jgi:hypothetical protein
MEWERVRLGHVRSKDTGILISDRANVLSQTVAASLHLLCSSLLEELEKPLNPSSEVSHPSNFKQPSLD